MHINGDVERGGADSGVQGIYLMDGRGAQWLVEGGSQSKKVIVREYEYWR